MDTTYYLRSFLLLYCDFLIIIFLETAKTFKADYDSTQLSLVKIVEIYQALVDLVLAFEHFLGNTFHRLVLQFLGFILVWARIGRFRIIRVIDHQVTKFRNEARLAGCHKA